MKLLIEEKRMTCTPANVDEKKGDQRKNKPMTIDDSFGIDQNHIKLEENAEEDCILVYSDDENVATDNHRARQGGNNGRNVLNSNANDMNDTLDENVWDLTNINNQTIYESDADGSNGDEVNSDSEEDLWDACTEIGDHIENINNANNATKENHVTSTQVVKPTPAVEVPRRGLKRFNYQIDASLYDISERSFLNRRIPSYGGSEIHKCNRCPVAFDLKSSLAKHMKTHIDEKLHQCDRCYESFANSSNLRRHMSIHERILSKGPFHCARCKIDFIDENEKKTHEKTCTDGLFSCTVCNKYSTRSKHNLKSHLKVHSSERPYRCDICMKDFKHKQSLKKHLGNIHNTML